MTGQSCRVTSTRSVPDQSSDQEENQSKRRAAGTTATAPATAARLATVVFSILILILFIFHESSLGDQNNFAVGARFHDVLVGPCGFHKGNLFSDDRLCLALLKKLGERRENAGELIVAQG